QMGASGPVRRLLRGPGQGGYYDAENLEVRFLEGGQGIDPAQTLISGQAAFGVLSPEDILIKRAQGAPLTAIAAIYRRSAVVYAAKADSGIRRPADFLGKRLAALGTAGSVRDMEFQLQAMMKKLDLDLSQARLLPYDSEYVAFYKGDVDVTAAYLTGGVVRMRQKGLKLNLIWPGDYGVHFYSDTLATTETMIDQKPELVTRFLRATLKGWQHAIGDPEMAVAATLRHAPDPDFQAAMFEALVPLVHTGQDHIGWMRPEDWERMHQVLMAQKIIATPLDMNKAFTIRFLAQAYGDPQP
ncbi:MAG: ABC transporter substrate-binding protein, partial [Desulfobacterales bacterium]|nr:ABC transporter substrate-binding protein [Desulfobacterales bacterium]